MKFRKKSVVIEAVQLREDNLSTLYNFLEIEGKGCFQDCGYGIDPSDGKFKITILEGVHEVCMGDWVIRGVKGEFYLCKPDIFAATYEPATAYTWHDVVHECERILGCPDTAESPLSSNFPNLVRELRKYKNRMDWLHTGGGETDRDAEGYEWGIARVKFNAYGQPISVLWTDSDHRDLDAEMERTKPQDKEI